MIFNNLHIKLLSVTIVILIITNLYSCGRDSCYKYYQVEYPFNMYSKSDTIDIGDTIYIDIAIANPFINKMGGEAIVLPSELIEHSVGIILIDGDSITLNSFSSTAACSSFDTYSSIGFLGVPYRNRLITMNYSLVGDSLKGSYRFIAKQLGTYVFHIDDDAFYHLKSDPLEDHNISLGDAECYEYYWHGLFKNQNQDNNLYIINKHYVHYDTTMFKYFDRNDPNYDKVNDHNPNNKNYPNDMKQNLKLGTYSFVVR